MAVSPTTAQSSAGTRSKRPPAFLEDDTMRAPCPSGKSGADNMLSACLRPHQACPVASRVSVCSPPCSEPHQSKVCTPAPLPAPLWASLTGTAKRSCDLVNTAQHARTLKSKPKPSSTNQLGKFQTESTSQVPPTPGERK